MPLVILNITEIPGIIRYILLTVEFFPVFSIYDITFNLTNTSKYGA